MRVLYSGSHWPAPRGLHPDEPLTAPTVAPQRDWHVFPLTADEQQTKLAALELHRTQWEVMAPFLRAFVRRNELFAP